MEKFKKKILIGIIRWYHDNADYCFFFAQEIEKYDNPNPYSKEKALEYSIDGYTSNGISKQLLIFIITKVQIEKAETEYLKSKADAEILEADLYQDSDPLLEKYKN